MKDARFLLNTIRLMVTISPKCQWDESTKNRQMHRCCDQTSKFLLRIGNVLKAISLSTRKYQHNMQQHCVLLVSWRTPSANSLRPRQQEVPRVSAFQLCPGQSRLVLWVYSGKTVWDEHGGGHVYGTIHCGTLNERKILDDSFRRPV